MRIRIPAPATVIACIALVPPGRRVLPVLLGRREQLGRPASFSARATST